MKVRVISAAVVIAIAIPFIYFGGAAYAFIIGVLAVLGMKEVIDLKKAHKPLPIIPSVLGIIACLLLVYTNFNGDSTIYGVTYARLIFTCLGLLLPTVFYKNDKYTTRDALYLIGTVVFLGIVFNSFILIRSKGIATFIYLALIPIITDSFALFVGQAKGKNKMSPEISPNKTWEGFIGGLVFGTVIPTIIYGVFVAPITIKVIIGTMILSIIGQIGDLIFSKIKRENEIKDFSNLMPGHGGVLDRLDSMSIIFITYIFLTTILF